MASNGRKLNDPLRIEDAVGNLSSGHLLHSTRLFEIELALTEIGSDISHIKKSLARQDRMNSALMELRVNDAKNVLVAADLMDD